MRWFDEAVARHQRERRAAEVAQQKKQGDAAGLLTRQQEEVELLDPLIQRLLSEYGEHLYGKGMMQKRFLVRLERPGKNAERSWNWHWHLYSLVKGKASIELSPTFNDLGVIQSFIATSGEKRVEIAAADEQAIKDGLVALYLQ